MKKKAGPLGWVLAGAVLLAIGSTLMRSNDAPAEAAPAPAKAAPAEDAAINAAINAVRALKKASKDPSSFALESFLYFPGGNTCIEYRAKNSFGALVPGRAVYRSSPAALLVQEQHGDRFVTAWNDVCTKQGGRERAKGLNALSAF